MIKNKFKKKYNNLLTNKNVHAFVDELFGEDLHAKRILSLANSTLGAIHSGALGIHAIGRGLAAANCLTDKHAIKQVDRYIGNEKIDVQELAPLWVNHCIAGNDQIIVNLDWTEFDNDNQSMLVLSLQTSHGRALPLMWETVVKSELTGRRNDIEDALLIKFRDAIPEDVNVIIVADRGFGDQKLFILLSDVLHFDYIIRIKSNIQVTNLTGETRSASKWVGARGRLRTIKNALITDEQTQVGMVVAVKEKNMDDSWCLVASNPDWSGYWVKERYGKRFTCEETFRDIKDMRYGFGMKWNPITKPDRRDRMMLLAVLAQALLTMLGAAGERAGLDRLLKANTSKKRTMSLLRQGLRWYELIPNMKEERLKILIESFTTMVSETELFRVLLSAK